MKRKLKRYALVTSDEEKNIGVIDLGLLEFGDEGRQGMLKSIENRMHIILEEHFDSEIEISNVDIKSVHPIMVTLDAKFIGEPEVKPFQVTLDETWVY